MDEALMELQIGARIRTNHQPARNRVQLALYALRNGLVRLEDVTLIPTGEAA